MSERQKRAEAIYRACKENYATGAISLVMKHLDEYVLAQRDTAQAEVERLRRVQDACRERIYALLCDDDLNDDKLREFAEGPLPEIHDALHQARGPAERYLRVQAEAARDALAEDKARLDWLENNADAVLIDGEELTFECLREAIDRARHHGEKR